MDINLWHVLPGTPGVDEVDALSKSLERGGLFTVVALLIIALVVALVSKERQRDRLTLAHETLREKLHTDYQTQGNAFQTKLLSIIERQAEVLTKQALLTEKVEEALTRVNARWDMESRGRERERG